MAYTTYEFYRAVYGGTMGEADFCRYAARAGYVLEAMTCERVKTLYPVCPADTPAARAIGMAMGALIDGLAQLEQTGGRTVILEAVGKHRVAYAATVQNAARDLRRTATPYLRGITDAFGVPLLYRGLEPTRPGAKPPLPPQVGCAPAKTAAPMPQAFTP